MKAKQPVLQDKIIYLDNAATSWPKPPGVSDAIKKFIDEIGANPGRSGHQASVQAARVVFSARKAISDFFNGPDPLRVIFTANITEALNLALLGLLHPGDHVITTSLEHNSVMRPLRFLETRGVELTVVESSRECVVDPHRFEVNIKKNTKLIVVNHASNVTGTILPVREIGKIARKHDLLFLTDEAQTGGAYPVDMQENCIDLLAFTGHKSLLGPTGTGGLILGDRVNHLQINPLTRGGTGSNSEKEEQPEILPDRFESGTLNASGLAGLAVSIQWIQKTGISNIRSHEERLSQRLIDGLNEITGVKVYGSWIARQQTATVSFTIHNIDNGKIGFVLDDSFGILCRIGLHCSPAAHKTIGTYPYGTVRLSIGYFNDEQEIDTTIRAIQKIAREAR